MTSLVRFSQVQVLKHFAGNLNLGCVLGLSALLFSSLGKLMLNPAPRHVSFTSVTGTLLVANFRMLFSSSEGPSTASMTACLPLIFELHPRVSRPFSPVEQEVRHQHRILLTDAICTILSLFKIGASPIRLSKHNVSRRREGDALACRLDVTNEELTVGNRSGISQRLGRDPAATSFR